MLSLIWHQNALPDTSPSALKSYPPLALKNALKWLGTLEYAPQGSGESPSLELFKKSEVVTGTWFRGGHGNARWIVGLDILVVFSILNDTIVLWCYDFKCLQTLSVCRWSLWLWHCWQINTISEPKNNRTRTKYGGFEWMPGKCESMPRYIFFLRTYMFASAMGIFWINCFFLFKRICT